MNTKDYTSLAVSQQLHKVGMKMETDAMWACPKDDGVLELTPSWQPSFYKHDNFPAYSTAQLAERLPKKIVTEDGLYFLRIIPSQTATGWYCYYECQTDGTKEDIVTDSDDLPDALGLMAVYLLENRLMNK